MLAHALRTPSCSQMACASEGKRHIPGRTAGFKTSCSPYLACQERQLRGLAHCAVNSHTGSVLL